MNKYNELFDELDLRMDKLKHKIKTSKVLCKNNTQNANEIVLTCNVYGGNKVLDYEVTVLGTSAVNISVKLDGAVQDTCIGLVCTGEILPKIRKVYSLSVVCTGEGILAAKLKLTAADLKII